MTFPWKILLVLGLLLVGTVGLIWWNSYRKGKLGKQKQQCGVWFVVGNLLYTFPSLSFQRHSLDIQ